MAVGSQARADQTMTGALEPMAVPFRGPVQAGVRQQPPAHATWLGMDIVSGAQVSDVRGLFQLWTDDFERLMSGRSPLTDLSYELADAGSALTLTLGVGRSLFDKLHLAGRPSWLDPLPKFSIDKFEAPWTATDLVIQIRCDDPLTLTHAAEVVHSTATGQAVLRWQQRGYRPAPRPGDGAVTRNAFGQLDGTVNPPADSALVWNTGGVPRWLAGGTSLVLRRIRMNMSVWSGVDREARENAIGRRLSDGSPLTGGGPSATPNLAATDDLGFPVIDSISHVRRAMPKVGHDRILRQPYTYDVGATGRSDVGLIFASYQADPVRQFLPIQQRLAEADLLNLWTTPIGSAVYAVLGGVAPGEYLGQHLL